MGVRVWPMVEVEADDALGAAALMAAADDRVERVVICTPDKDLGQCVGGKVVQWDRRQDRWFDVEGVTAKFGVPPESIPDWLALVGDSADGFPGLAGFGAKSAAAVLARFGHLEDIPAAGEAWGVGVRNAGRLAATLVRERDLAFLFRRLATLETDVDDIGSVDDLRWSGPTADFADWSGRLDAPGLAARAERLSATRA
jgi:5'-3' exonuclease